MIKSKYKFIDNISVKYYWIKHLIWSIYILLKCMFKLDLKGFNEAYLWIKIHLTYKSKRIK